MSSVDACGICFNNFDGSSHEALSLPCNHVFCSQCLTNMQTSNSKNCPMCRQDWQEYDVETLEKYCDHNGYKNDKTAENATLTKDQKQNYDVKADTAIKCNKVLCKEHSLPFYYFCDHCKEFSCMKCVITKQSHCTFILICDAVDLIKADISTKAEGAKYDTESDLDQLKKTLSEINEKLVSVTKFSQEIASMQHKLTSLIENLEVLKVKRVQDLNKVAEVVDSLAEIDTENDLMLVQACRDSLKIVQESKVNSFDCPELSFLLCRIACAFLDTSRQAELGSREVTCFIKNLQGVNEIPIVLKITDTETRKPKSKKKIANKSVMPLEQLPSQYNWYDLGYRQNN